MTAGVWVWVATGRPSGCHLLTVDDKDCLCQECYPDVAIPGVRLGRPAHTAPDPGFQYRRPVLTRRTLLTAAIASAAAAPVAGCGFGPFHEGPDQEVVTPRIQKAARSVPALISGEVYYTDGSSDVGYQIGGNVVVRGITTGEATSAFRDVLRAVATEIKDLDLPAVTEVTADARTAQGSDLRVKAKEALETSGTPRVEDLLSYFGLA